MNVLPLELSFFVERLRQKEPVSYVRYGDGEFLAILGTKGSNCDGAQYFDDLAEALRETLESPRDYMHGIGPKILNRKNGLTQSSISWIEKHCPQIEWYDSEVFLTAMLAGQFYPLTNALRERKVLLVGNASLRQAPIPFDEFVEIPRLNAWLNYAATLDRIQSKMHSVNTVLFCGGMMAKVCLYDLFPTWGKTHFMLDCGSIFDQTVGVLSRSYSRRLKPEERETLNRVNFNLK